MKFSTKDFSSKCDQIRWKLQVWSHLLKKSLIEVFIFSSVRTVKKRIETHFTQELKNVKQSSQSQIFLKLCEF